MSRPDQVHYQGSNRGHGLPEGSDEGVPETDAQCNRHHTHPAEGLSVMRL